MRVDAKAEGMSIAVGGWRPTYNGDGVIDKSISPWFSIKLDAASAPWAFHKGLPYRTISALELLASTVGLVLLGPGAQGNSPCNGLVQVSGLTDSMVATNVLARGISTSFPLCLVAMEMAVQLEEHQAELSLDWIPRTMNKEADALADGITEGFSAAKDLSVQPDKLPLKVLPALLAEATEFYKNNKPVAFAPPKKMAKLKGGRLRDTQPW